MTSKSDRSGPSASGYETRIAASYTTVERGKAAESSPVAPAVPVNAPVASTSTPPSGSAATVPAEFAQ